MLIYESRNEVADERCEDKSAKYEDIARKIELKRKAFGLPEEGKDLYAR